MTPFDLLRLILAVWWIAYAVSNTDGLFKSFKWVRDKLPHGRTWVFDIRVGDGNGKSQLKDGLLDCIICLAPWVALILILLNVEIVLNVFAVAGGAVLLHGYTGWRVNY